jgi:hypothetical protein
MRLTGRMSGNLADNRRHKTMAIEYIKNWIGLYNIVAYPVSSAQFAACCVQIATLPNESFWLVPGTFD